jgi:hypothetical protein
MDEMLSKDRLVGRLRVSRSDRSQLLDYVTTVNNGTRLVPLFPVLLFFYFVQQIKKLAVA